MLSFVCLFYIVFVCLNWFFVFFNFLLPLVVNKDVQMFIITSVAPRTCERPLKVIHLTQATTGEGFVFGPPAFVMTFVPTAIVRENSCNCRMKLSGQYSDLTVKFTRWQRRTIEHDFIRYCSQEVK